MTNQMKLGYKKIEEIASGQLPFVTSNIQLTFGFITSPAYWFMRDVAEWGAKCDAGEIDEAQTISLAAHLIKYVNTPDGESYELGDEESIKAFIDSTSLDFLVTIIAGWLFMAGMARAEHKKKQESFSEPLHANGNKKPKAKDLSNS
jgi:hypothetical protein